MGKHAKVSPAEMKRFMELYDTYGTYAAVARKCGRSAQTVAKYVRMAVAAGISVEETEDTDNKSIKVSGKKTITITLD